MTTRTVRHRSGRQLLYAALLLSAAGLLAEEAGTGQVELTSPVVEPGGELPMDHTQFAQDISPPLQWSGLPQGAQQLALIFDGPYDVQPQPFVYWVVYDIPATASGLPAGLPMDALLEQPAAVTGVRQGPTGWDSPGYRGPWPVREPQTYVFTLYVLDADLDLPPGLGKDALLAAIASHVIATGELRVTSRAGRLPS